MLDTQNLTNTLREFLARAKQEQAAINERIEKATAVLVGLTDPGSAPARLAEPVEAAPVRRGPGRPKGSKTKKAKGKGKSGKSAAPAAEGRRGLSAAQRRDISVRMKKYWAERRAAATAS